MITAEIGLRVKMVRRGCEPTYGTIIALDSADESGDRFVRVAWDSGATCMVTERELQPVKRERRRLA
jgi:hypothetical protein